MWEPYRQSIEQWAPRCCIVYDKFHIMQHANRAVDEVRRAEFFRKGGGMRGLVKGKRWLLLTTLGESDGRQAAATQRAVCAQPAIAESLFGQGEAGSAGGFSLTRGGGGG